MIIEEIWQALMLQLSDLVSFQQLQKGLEAVGPDKLIGTCLLKVVSASHTRFRLYF